MLWDQTDRVRYICVMHTSECALREHLTDNAALQPGLEVKSRVPKRQLAKRVQFLAGGARVSFF